MCAAFRRSTTSACHTLSRGSFEYFSADMLAADPHGSLIAAGDDGGCDETAMGATTARGEPQVTLIDADRRVQTGAIERGHPTFGLEFDPWRGRLLTVLHRDVGAWSRTGEAIARFAPYPNAYARSLAVSERWIATVPATGERARIDFFDPEHVRAPRNGRSARAVCASLDRGERRRQRVRDAGASAESRLRGPHLDRGVTAGLSERVEVKVSYRARAGWALAIGGVLMLFSIVAFVGYYLNAPARTARAARASGRSRRHSSPSRCSVSASSSSR
jgi:hypothetical protein